MDKATMPAAPQMEPPKPTVEQHPTGEPVSLQIIGGLTLANTMVSALALFWVFMEYGLFA